MQAVADHKGLFLDPYIGWPGKVYDARVFVNSSLYCKGVNSLIGSERFGVQVPLVLLGDPAYPALPWLKKPYPERMPAVHVQFGGTTIGKPGLECQLKMLLADLGAMDMPP